MACKKREIRVGSYMLLICALLTLSVYTWSINIATAKITSESKMQTLTRVEVDKRLQPIFVESAKIFEAEAEAEAEANEHGAIGTAKPVVIEKLNFPPPAVVQSAPPQVVEQSAPPEVVEQSAPPEVVEQSAPPQVAPPEVVEQVAPPEVVEQVAPPEVVRLEVSNILQNPELPNGCEATSLSMVLAYKGFNVSKTEIASKYLPKARFYRVGKERKLASGDPNDFYIGDPTSKDDAYYCYAKPIAQAGNAYLQGAGSALVAKDITGADEQTLVNALAAGNPVIALATINMGNAAFYTDKPLIINKRGDVHIPFANLHCVVLSGYDNEFFYYSDPLSGNAKSKRKTFINAYKQIGSRAVIIE